MPFKLEFGSQERDLHHSTDSTLNSPLRVLPVSFSRKGREVGKINHFCLLETKRFSGMQNFECWAWDCLRQTRMVIPLCGGPVKAKRNPPEKGKALNCWWPTLNRLWKMNVRPGKGGLAFAPPTTMELPSLTHGRGETNEAKRLKKAVWCEHRHSSNSTNEPWRNWTFMVRVWGLI